MTECELNVVCNAFGAIEASSWFCCSNNKSLLMFYWWRLQSSVYRPHPHLTALPSLPSPHIHAALRLKSWCKQQPWNTHFSFTHTLVLRLKAALMLTEELGLTTALLLTAALILTTELQLWLKLGGGPGGARGSVSQSWWDFFFVFIFVGHDRRLLWCIYVFVERVVLILCCV